MKNIQFKIAEAGMMQENFQLQFSIQSQGVILIKLADIQRWMDLKTCRCHHHLLKGQKAT